MRVTRLCGVAVAILLTAMVGRSNADLIVEMDAASVSGVPAADYTLTPNGVTFNSSLLANNQQIGVTMYVYADVLDATNNIANYAQNNPSHDGLTYLQAINLGVLPGQGSDTTSDPFVNVGIQQAALSFGQTTSGSLAIPGSMTATPNSAGFSFEHKSGASTSTTPPNNIGYGSDLDTYFFAQTTNYDPNPADAGFSFLTYSSSNGSVSSGTQLVTFTGTNGQTYDKICLGKLTYTFTNTSSLVGNSVSVSANPAVSVGGVNTFLWMQDGTIYAGAPDTAQDPVGTVGATAPVFITLAPTAVPVPSMTLSGTAAFARVLRNGTDPVGMTIGNSGGAA